MNIGIIIYSRTGNTNSVALKLQEKLQAAGHSAHLEQLKVAGELKPGVKEVHFEVLPAVTKYDFLVFGSPVEAFSLAPAMKSYLTQIASLKGKKVVLIITQFLRYPWMGGSHAAHQMKVICKSEGAVICGSGIINWSSPGRDQQIISCVDELNSIINKEESNIKDIAAPEDR